MVWAKKGTTGCETAAGSETLPDEGCGGLQALESNVGQGPVLPYGWSVAWDVVQGSKTDQCSLLSLHMT